MNEAFFMNREAVFDSCCQRIIPYEYLKVNDQITPTILEKNLGNKNFIDVYCQSCKPIQKILIGCDSKLKGPKNLWIDPNNNKIQFTPVNDIQKVQALTHQTILKIGEEIEEKIANQNSKLTEKAIQEVHEFAKFEADERIKFHIENITEKLRGECENRISELAAQHEQTLIKFYGMNSDVFVSGKREGRMRQNDDEQVMRDKCQREVKEMMTNKAHAGDDNNKDDDADDDDDKLMRNSRDCDENLSHYISTSAHHEQMRNILLNLDERCCCDDDEKRKNECLKAMDLQRELMLSRHITEIMHLIAIIRQQDKLNSSIVSTQQQHQEEVTMNEMKDELLHDSIKCNEKTHKSDQMSETFGQNQITQKPSFSFIQLKSQSTSQQQNSKNSFTNSVLNRFIQASQRENSFNSHDNNNGIFLGGDKTKSILPSLKTMEKTTFAPSIHPSTTDVDDVLLLNTEASDIKNSLEVSEQKQQQSQAEQYSSSMTSNLLATVDSLELISSTKSFNQSSNNKKNNLKSHQLMLSKLPPYMIMPHLSTSKLKLSMKMSENYSNVLVDERTSNSFRSSKVHFSETSDDNGKTLTILMPKKSSRIDFT